MRLLFLAVWLAPCLALAHPTGLVRVRVIELDGEVHVGVRSPGEPLTPPRLGGCGTAGAPTGGAAGEWAWRTWTCPDGLDGVTVDLADVDLTGARVAVELNRAGAMHTTLVDPRAGPWAIPAQEPPSGPVLVPFMELGVRHILGGIDHLLFVAGLLFLVTGPRRLLLTLTAFTLGHSVTLAVGALGGPTPAAAPAEAWIAGSIVLLGRELVRRRSETESDPHAAGLAALFGLAHGFGFAGALSEAGLPEGSAVVALAGFNVGVEVGQILFVGVVGAVLWLGRRWLGAERGRARVATGWVLGVAGSYWFVERVLALG